MQSLTQSSSGPQSVRVAPSRFVDHMQQLFGDDPDPLFLEESWSVGVPAAIENLHRRRRQHAVNFSQSDTSGQDLALRELERMASLTENVATFLEDRSQPIENRYSPAWLQCMADEFSEESFSVNQSELPFAPARSVSTAHQLLGVSEAAGREEIRSAYRRKVSQCHPDRCQDESDAVRRGATQQLANLNEAYRVLCEQMCRQAA